MESVKLQRMNLLGSQGEPFLFIIDFNMENPVVIPLKDVDPAEIMYDFEGVSNCLGNDRFNGNIEFKKYPPSYEEYYAAFKLVRENLIYGNSYLVNLTLPTKIETGFSLKEIYIYSKARFKLLFHEQFVVFSPEPFVKTHKGKIYSYPMKGTIDASVPDAEKMILQNAKETAEHSTIVDLIRNDLSMIAGEVRVEAFRYVEKLITNSGELLQVSSRISGKLPEDFSKKIGSMLFRLLPAGSISGAPKEKTVEIIKSAENYNRGFYTGVMGIFDGTDITSSVMIRFIEKTEKGLYYKSGGGITIHSNPEEEYKELISKVYVPFI